MEEVKGSNPFRSTKPLSYPALTSLRRRGSKSQPKGKLSTNNKYLFAPEPVCFRSYGRNANRSKRTGRAKPDRTFSVTNTIRLLKNAPPRRIPVDARVFGIALHAHARDWLIRVC
jgi:hypothetical protein